MNTFKSLDELRAMSVYQALQAGTVIRFYPPISEHAMFRAKGVTYPPDEVKELVKSGLVVIVAPENSVATSKLALAISPYPASKADAIERVIHEHYYDLMTLAEDTISRTMEIKNAYLRRMNEALNSSENGI